MKKTRGSMLGFAAAIGLASCAGSTAPADSRISVVPDAADPRVVRFEVPTALVMGLPGERVPITLQARIATRELAARELAAAHYCPRGFSGPERLDFPEGNRARTHFTVRCLE